MQTGPSNIVFVAGMGPAGLVAAIEAARKGYVVYIVEPRLDMTRGQRVLVDGNTTRFLQGLKDERNLEDIKFFEKISHNGGTNIELKDIQKYLIRKLADFRNIHSYQGSSVVEIDPNKRQATVQTKDGLSVIDFTHFVAADGARREMVSFLNRGTTNLAQQIQYHDLEVQPRQMESGTITFKVKSGKVLPNRPTQDVAFKVEDLPRLRKYGWDKPYFPKVYIFSNKDNSKLFVSGEIPSGIYKIQDKKAQREALIRWGKLMINIKLRYNHSDVEFVEKNSKDNPKQEAKNKLKATAFPLSLSNADKPSIRLGEKGSFVLVGDAFKNANFFLAHGVNDAIKDGQNFGKCLSNNPQVGSFNLNEYNQYQTAQLTGLVRTLKAGSDPAEMQNIKLKIEKFTFDLIALANSVSAKTFIEQIAKMRTHLLSMSADEDMEMFNEDIKVFVNQISDILAAKEKKHFDLFCGLLGNKYEQKKEQLDELAIKLNERLCKYFDLNASQTMQQVSSLQTPAAPLTLSISGNIIETSPGSNNCDLGILVDDDPRKPLILSASKAPKGKQVVQDDRIEPIERRREYYTALR